MPAERVVRGGGFDRTLRTTQWTRASSIHTLCGVSHWSHAFLLGGVRFLFTYVISSFEEQTVDALASGAEEGRSNLR